MHILKGINMISLVFAVGAQLQFGNSNSLPWNHIKEDMQRFKDVTKGKVLVMGSNTFVSLPKCLPDRMHVVLSRNSDVRARDGSLPDVIIDDIEELREMMLENENTDFCVIGGPSIIDFFSDIADEVHMTVVDINTLVNKKYCDVLFNPNTIRDIVSSMNLVSIEKLVFDQDNKVLYNKFVR